MIYYKVKHLGERRNPGAVFVKSREKGIIKIKRYKYCENYHSKANRKDDYALLLL